MYLSKCLFRFQVNISPAIHFFIILPNDIRETKPQTKPRNRKAGKHGEVSLQF